jgi:hypothetical protein
MSYYLRGSDGDFSGLGDIAAPAYETCNPSDSACVARNQVLNAAYNLAIEQAANAQHLADCLHLGYPAATCHAQFDPGGTADATANAGEPVQGYSTLQAQTQAAASAPSAPAAFGGHVTFTSSRGSNALQVGDSWLVSITGATPNAPVTVNAGGSTTQMGTTDANGNFSLSGTARTQDIGPWNELWSVGGLNSGAFQFTISAPASGSTAAGAAAGSPAAGTSTSAGSAAGASSSSTVIGGFDLSSIPTWGWLAAAGVAAFFMFGKGGR